MSCPTAFTKLALTPQFREVHSSARGEVGHKLIYKVDNIRHPRKLVKKSAYKSTPIAIKNNHLLRRTLLEKCAPMFRDSGKRHKLNFLGCYLYSTWLMLYN